jgi:hypothetical protein
MSGGTSMLTVGMTNAAPVPRAGQMAPNGIVMSGWRPLIKGYFAVAR